MRILLTNDDGIGAEGLRLLADFVRSFEEAEIVVAAPLTEQSAKSQSIELRRPIAVKRVPYGDRITAYTVDSTPADCVRFALTALGTPFDLVLSGVNRGFNLGDDVSYSGTCAAASEAALRGVPAAALSADPASFGGLKRLGDVWRVITAYGTHADGSVLNVNFPSVPRGIAFTRQGGAYYQDHMLPVSPSDGGEINEGETSFFMADGYFAYRDRGDLTLDTDAVTAGYISVTPLTVSRTDEKELERLRQSVPGGILSDKT